MAAEDGPAPDHLSFLGMVAQAARRFGIFPVLRGAEARARNLPRIGQAKLPAQDVVEINQWPSLTFPGATLHSVELNGRRPRVNGYWLGLTGPMGPLPLHLTEFAAYERRYARSRPFGRFLDLLSRRMLQFFYRAWADSQPAAQADRVEDDRFAAYLSALSGAGEGAREDGAFARRARIHYAALFASARSAAGIEDALAHLLGAPVSLIEYQGGWRRMAPEDRTRLGSAFSTLGGDAVLGGAVKSVSDAFRVVIRTNALREYEDFLPTGRRFKIAAEALDAFSPSHLDWEIEIQLNAGEAQPARLDGRARLGWTGWLSRKGSPGLRADARLGRNARALAGQGRRTR